jgi:hypothetical protein
MNHGTTLSACSSLQTLHLRRRQARVEDLYGNAKAASRSLVFGDTIRHDSRPALVIRGVDKGVAVGDSNLKPGLR